MSSRYSQGVAWIFFSTGSRLLSCRFTGSRWVILLNGFQTIVQQILRDSLGHSSQRVLDYCPVDSQGVVGLFFSTGSRLLSSRFTGSRCVILLNGFQTNVQQIFTGSRQDFLLNGFQTVVLQIHRESLGYSSQRVLDYCPVDSQVVAGIFFSACSSLMSTRYSQGVAGIFFSTRPRLLSCRFTGSRWVILLDGLQTIVQQIHRESLGYSSQRVLDFCQVDSQGVAGLFSSTGSRRMSTRYSQGVAGIFFSTRPRLLSCRFTGSRWVILLDGFQTIVQQIHRESLGFLLNVFQTFVKQIHRESLGYSPQRVLDECPLDIHRESLGFSSQRVLDCCPVDSQGVAGLLFSTGSRLLSSRYSHGVAGYSSQRFLDYCPVEIHRESLGFFSQRILDYCRVDIHRESLDTLLNGYQTIVQQIFTGSCWVILLNGFQTIVKQILRESLGYSPRRVLD